jgi:hypothetical protein
MGQLPSATTPLRVAAWLTPWLVALLVAAGIAYAADVAMLRAWPVVPQADLSDAPPPDAPHWISLVVSTQEGARYGMRCLARPGTFTADKVWVDALDVDMFATRACLQLEARGDAN